MSSEPSRGAEGDTLLGSFGRLLPDIQRLFVGAAGAHEVDAASAVEAAEHDGHLAGVDGTAHAVPETAVDLAAEPHGAETLAGSLLLQEQPDHAAELGPVGRTQILVLQILRSPALGRNGALLRQLDGIGNGYPESLQLAPRLFQHGGMDAPLLPVQLFLFRVEALPLAVELHLFLQALQDLVDRTQGCHDRLSFSSDRHFRSNQSQGAAIQSIDAAIR